MYIRHELEDNDFQRLGFCEWFSGKCRKNRFLPNFVISDEANFAMNGVVNTWNVSEYALKGQPPEDFLYDRNESRETIMVWGGMCGNGMYGNGLLFGPSFIEGNLTGAKYQDLLVEQVFSCLDGAFRVPIW